MADADEDMGKDLAAAFAADEETANPTPAEDPKKPEEPAPPADPAKEEPKKDEPVKPEDPKKPEEGTPPADSAKKPEEGDPAAKDPKAPGAAEEPVAAQPLTKDDAESIFRNIQLEERNSGKVLESTTKEVLEAYYPEGLSNTLVDQKSGKELKTPADVVEASGGEMSVEQASQWLMNEQFKLDQSVNQIKADAEKVAETTINFKRDATTVLRKYAPLFKAYPTLQDKTFNKLMKLVKADTEKSVILSAPDVMEFYDDALEPYQKAFEYATKQSATAPTGEPAKDEPAKPGAEDRLDEGGDGGVTKPDDPNDFAQQVGKELAKGIV